ncbi:DUF2142 domain-containing protein [Gryllotalpicola koreensis]|uniref:DUF2142 domain-containing protein n=1 Tax=Gryllotalpicola koreensis TaxID=993086 RepID=A0ABP8A1E4_9MICO
MGRLLTAHWMFAIIAAVGCALFIVITPAGYGLDEQSHVYRAEQISEGIWWAQLVDLAEGWGGDVPKTLYDYEQSGWLQSNSVDRSKEFYERSDAFDATARRHFGARPYDVDGARVTTDFVNSAVYSPVPYLPAAAGFVIARVVHADVAGALTIARVLNALVYLVIVFAALLLVRDLVSRWLILVIALLPEVVFQSSVITADTFSDAGGLLFTAVVLRLMSHPIRGLRTSTAVLGLAALALAVMKPSYAPLLLLILAIPARNLGGTLSGWITKAAAIVVPLVVTAGVYLITAGPSADLVYQRADLAAQIVPAEQLRHVLTDPIGFAGVIIRTITIFGDSWRVGIVGLFGYDTIEVPEPLKIIAMALLLISGLRAAKLRPRTALLWLVAALGVFLAVIGALYLTFMPVGAIYASGVQGRYFLPMLAVAILGLSSLLPVYVAVPRRWEPLVFAVPAAFVLVCSVAVYAIALY